MKPHSTGRLALGLLREFLAEVETASHDGREHTFHEGKFKELAERAHLIISASRGEVDEPRAGIAFAAMRAGLDGYARDPGNTLKLVADIIAAIEAADVKVKSKRRLRRVA